jgi:hypothetical protein
MISSRKNVEPPQERAQPSSAGRIIRAKLVRVGDSKTVSNLPIVKPTQRAEVLRALKTLGIFGAICGAIGAVFFWVNQHLPYIQPGSDIVYSTKVHMLRTENVLDMSKPVRVLVFGDSKALAGFNTAFFERELPGVSAYNCGLPASREFIDELTAMVDRGQVPTHILVSVSWEDPPQRRLSFFHFIPSDRALMDELFPFRHFLRNLALFVLRSPKFGGLGSYYEHGREVNSVMQSGRGYYFIDAQSRFAGNRLPDDFTMMGDSQSVEYRKPATSSENFAALRAIADRYGIKILVVPYYRRIPERGDPGVNTKMVEALRPFPEFRVLGDEYLRYPNRYFSDTGHLNPEGADLYTAEIARLMKDELVAERAQKPKAEWATTHNTQPHAL